MGHTGAHGIEFPGTGVTGGAAPYLAQYRDGLITEQPPSRSWVASDPNAQLPIRASAEATARKLWSLCMAICVVPQTNL